jgi:meso-butanediol dehydrogenase / (S,S)-butanediol dehydrogenase / diacetyl reductase
MEDKRVVLITGGGSGLGQTLVRHFLDAGLCVCTTIRGKEHAVQNDYLHYFDVDMNDHAALLKVMENVIARCNRLDALICNAAVQGFGHVKDISRQNWQETLDVNLTAPFLLAQAAAPHLKSTNGLITFISSVHGVLAAPSRTMYAVSKAGLIAMARNMAADLSSDGIRVVSLILGPFASPALTQGALRFFPDDTPEDAVQKFADRQPLGRVGSAEELGALIEFLMTDAAGFITGTSITIDGGQSSRLAIPEIKGEGMEP